MHPAACSQLPDGIVKQHTDGLLADAPCEQTIRHRAAVTRMAPAAKATDGLPKLVAGFESEHMGFYANSILSSTQGVVSVGGIVWKSLHVLNLYRKSLVQETDTMSLMQYNPGKDEVRKQFKVSDTDFGAIVEMSVTSFLDQLDDAKMSASDVSGMVKAVDKDMETLCGIGAKDAVAADREALKKTIKEARVAAHKRQQLLASFKSITVDQRYKVELLSLL